MSDDRDGRPARRGLVGGGRRERRPGAVPARAGVPARERRRCRSTSLPGQLHRSGPGEPGRGRTRSSSRCRPIAATGTVGRPARSRRSDDFDYDCTLPRLGRAVQARRGGGPGVRRAAPYRARRARPAALRGAAHRSGAGGAAGPEPALWPGSRSSAARERRRRCPSRPRSTPEIVAFLGTATRRSPDLLPVLEPLTLVAAVAVGSVDVAAVVDDALSWLTVAYPVRS